MIETVSMIMCEVGDPAGWSSSSGRERIIVDRDRHEG